MSIGACPVRWKIRGAHFKLQLPRSGFPVGLNCRFEKDRIYWLQHPVQLDNWDAVLTSYGSIQICSDFKVARGNLHLFPYHWPPPPFRRCWSPWASHPSSSQSFDDDVGDVHWDLQHLFSSGRIRISSPPFSVWGNPGSYAPDRSNSGLGWGECPSSWSSLGLTCKTYIL